MGGPGIETERKFEGGAAGPRLDTRALPGVGQVVPAADEELDAVYYDTHDLRLLAHGTTLRRRRGGHDAGWHLKRPLDGDRREETAWPDTGDDVLPEALAVRVIAVARGAAVIPVLRLRTRREREHLLDRKGARLAEVAHDHVAAELLRRPGYITAWSELEVEVEVEPPKNGKNSKNSKNSKNGKNGKNGKSSKSGKAAENNEAAEAAALLDAVETQLSDAGWHRSDAPSKAARAFADTGAAPASATPSRAARPGSIGHAVHARIATQRDALLAADPGVRLDDPEGVHDMRVAARRLRSLLRSYRRCFDRRVTDPIADELRDLGRSLGEARDHQVLAARVLSTATELCEADESTCFELADAASRIDAAESTAYQQKRLSAVEDLNRKRYFRLLDRLELLVSSPPFRPGRADRKAPRELRKVVRKEQRRLARRAARIDSATDPGDRDTALHATRKAAKRARYAAEVAIPISGHTGANAARFAKRTKAVQRLLGEHQDSVVARDMLRTRAADAHAEGADTFAYGLLYAAEQRAAERAEEKLPKVRAKAEQRRLARI
ncbi:CYTH and CHAD domain-containing protein [Yinghuangia soli]|uniref:CYTH and CHAD domain-containing protein n=1 Tax=Yinghuangia soli TaxID=2908204 RepID=A0AA41U6W2_9ACTN|nr:CYTH and CHAD domain-containing protein [Yinghuangia soli]MCF2533432.1 CYTH and CHAD domain-containing protein [Yinghuangia soli]